MEAMVMNLCHVTTSDIARKENQINEQQKFCHHLSFVPIIRVTDKPTFAFNYYYSNDGVIANVDVNAV